MNAPAAPSPYSDEAPAAPAVAAKSPYWMPKRGTPEYEAMYPESDLAADTRTAEEMYAEVTRSQLKRRGFSDSDVEWWINVAKVRHCNIMETLNRFNVRNNSRGDRADGLLIPYLDADGKPVIDDGRVFERIRLSHFDGNGKYRSEYGTVPHAYLPPLPHGKTWRGVFNDPTEIIAITEGEFKAGVSTMAPDGIPTIGLGGVDCFVTKHGRVPELAGIKLKNRTVFIVFDAPISSRVRAGIQKALNHLVAYGANVKVAHIERTAIYADLLEKSGADPEDPNTFPKMGLDDYLQAGGRWCDLMDKEVAVDLIDSKDGTLDGDIDRSLTLLHQIAIITGTSRSSFIHLEGENIGLMRYSASMAEVLAPHKIQIPTRNGFTEKAMFDIWISNRRRIELRGVVVRPDLPPLSITPDNNWNSWRGLATVPKRNDQLAKYYRDFVHDFFEHDTEDPATVELHRKRFMQWNADLFQNPGERPYTSWTLISKDEGIGKSILLELNAHIIGTGEDGGAFIADADNLDTEWTSFYNGKIYIVFNEPSNDNSKMRQKAKNLRTNAYLDCNTKYGAHFRIPNILSFGFTTNEPYAFGISETARRDWVWEPKWKQTDAEWMARARRFGELAGGKGPESDEFRSAVLYELLFNVDLSDYDPKAPAGNSKAKARAANQSSSLVDLRRKDLMKEITALTKDWTTDPEPRAIAWVSESWEKWIGDSYNKSQSDADKKMLNGEMEKLGLFSGSERYKYRGKQDRVWFIGNRRWGDLTAEQKTAAKEWGDREAGNFFDPEIGKQAT